MSQFFPRHDGTLYAEGVPLTRIAEAYGTPFYCYSRANLQTEYRALATAMADLNPLICFAVKACPNISVIHTLAEQGAGADVVSVGEMQRALAAGVPANKIIFSGVGKTPEEITAAATAGIYQFNVESVPELATIASIGEKLGMRLPIALRINPDVDPRTHAKISTGQKETKFGISLAHLEDSLAIIRQQPALDFCGIAVHIGSQLTELEPFDQAFSIVAALIKGLQTQGHTIRRVDLGGGIGICYADETPPSPEAYAALVRQHFGNSGLHIGMEPGRRLVGEAGILVSRVIYAKHGEDKNFLIIDAAMNDLVRPAMYEAWHDIVPVQAPTPTSATADAPAYGGEAARRLSATTLYDVVGPICETSDLFGQDRLLPTAQPDDLIAITCAGAYGASMSSTYNARTLIPEIMVDGETFALIRRPVTIDEQIQWDVPPVWVK